MNEITDQAVINRLVQSEAGRKAAADIMRDHTAERMDLKSRAEKLRRERGERTRELADAEAAARKRVEAARRELSEAEQAHRQSDMAHRQAAAHYTARIQKLERQLRATAPATIDEFIAWLDDAADECRATVITEKARKTDKLNTHTSEPVKEYFSNAPSLRNRLETIKAARQEAERLKDLVLDHTDVQERLDALRDNLPAVEMQYSHTR